MGRRTETNREKKQRRKRQRALKDQKKQVAIRAKFGPQKKPAPVIVKSLETGEVLNVLDQSDFRSRYAASLEMKAKALGFKGYAGYLRSKHWRVLRARVLERDDHRCCRCGREERLNVHHRYYDAALGAERLSSLQTLCEDCHRRAHS